MCKNVNEHLASNLKPADAFLKDLVMSPGVLQHFNRQNAVEFLLIKRGDINVILMLKREHREIEISAMLVALVLLWRAIDSSRSSEALKV